MGIVYVSYILCSLWKYLFLYWFTHSVLSLDLCLLTHFRCTDCFSWLHSMTHTIGRTPVARGSARRRDLYLETRNNHKIQTSMHHVEFEPTIPSKWAAADPCIWKSQAEKSDNINDQEISPFLGMMCLRKWINWKPNLMRCRPILLKHWFLVDFWKWN
jgi:hypothetical protein